jgi:amino acid transporter
MDLSAETARIVLSEKLEEARSTTTYAATIFTFYIAINGLLLKSVYIDGLEETARAQLAAVLTGIVYIIVCYFYLKARKYIVSDINHLNVYLGKPLKNEQLLPLKYTAWTAGLFALSCTVFWLLPI